MIALEMAPLPVEDHSAAMAELEAYMTQRFPASPAIGKMHCASTGDPYVVLSCGGVKQQGEPHGVFTTHVADAIEIFKAEFDKFSADQRGTLYWRRKPEVVASHYPDRFVGGYNSYYCVNARFVISDKPVLSPAPVVVLAAPIPSATPRRNRVRDW